MASADLSYKSILCLFLFLGSSADDETYSEGCRMESSPHNHAVCRQSYVMEQFDACSRHKDESVFGRDCMTV